MCKLVFWMRLDHLTNMNVTRNTWEHTWEICKRVDRPNFGLCLDTFQICGNCLSFLSSHQPRSHIPQSPHIRRSDIVQRPPTSPPRRLRAPHPVGLAQGALRDAPALEDLLPPDLRRVAEARHRRAQAERRAAGRVPALRVVGRVAAAAVPGRDRGQGGQRGGRVWRVPACRGRVRGGAADGLARPVVL